MASEEENEDERPRSDPPLPPDDRLWRHPSEVAAGAALPAAWPTPAAPAGPHRGVQLAALGGAALAGMVVAMSVMWVTRPTRVVVHRMQPSTTQPITSVTFSQPTVPTQELAKRLAPSLVMVAAAQGDRWSSGTGIWLDGDGTVAVASTLVAGSDDIVVTDADGTKADALVTGTDTATGITTLKVSTHSGKPLPAAASEPEAGQPVAIIGAVSTSPQGEADQRVLPASISATGVRTTVSLYVLHDAAQLDRAVPADAVGSVVVDAEGHPVGIVLSQSGDSNLAVVTPAIPALAAARELRDDGSVHRAWLGVEVVDLTPAATKMMGLDGGAKLTKVMPSSPADAAGLEVGDVISAVDGRAIDDASDLVVALRTWAPGDHVVITWNRGRHTNEAELTLGG